MSSVVRGDVVELPARRVARGHEQRGRRYGVILQADDLSALSTVVLAPTSTSAPSRAFRAEAVIDATVTRILVEQIVTVDRRRVGRVVGHLSWNELLDVERVLGLVLGLRPT